MALDRLLRSLFDLADTLAEANRPARVSAPQAARSLPNPADTPLPPPRPTGGPAAHSMPAAGTPVPPPPAIGTPKPSPLTSEEHESQKPDFDHVSRDRMFDGVPQGLCGPVVVVVGDVPRRRVRAGGETQQDGKQRSRSDVPDRMSSGALFHVVLTLLG